MIRIYFLLLTSLFVAPTFAQRASPPALVINEILFDPKPGGSDYIELFNRSDKPVDISHYFLTNRTGSGAYGVLKKLGDSTRLLQPAAYIVVTEDSADLLLRYFVKNPGAVLPMSSLPSYPNTGGVVVLLDSAKNNIDEVAYNENRHHDLIRDGEGVALERINPAANSNEKTNWRSAASDAGYGTPGYQNSQHQLFQNPMLQIAVVPKIFSPDGDGFDDVLAIEYTVGESGTVANIFIYDAAGRRVRHLQKNVLLGSSGKFVWDGLDDNNQRLPVGQYIILTEVFNVQGRKRQTKNVVVLAQRKN